MKYLGQQNDIDNANDKIGVLLVNLGTPDKAICPSLRTYLGEFLMDPRVIELPKLLRFILVRGVIVNFRSHKSAATYREIWTEQGSPLLINSQQLTRKVSNLLGDNFAVELAMRYGNPSLKEKLSSLHQQGIRKLIIIPLYPQYSGSTNGSTFDSVSQALSQYRWVPDLKFVSAYHQRDTYIRAIGNSIKTHWQEHGRAQKLLMSFHGVPKKYITKGDPYESQCRDSAQRIADYLELAESDWQLVFQSRFGAQEWLKPYCDQTLKQLPTQGIKSIDIVCPGFSVDCLETLEEINGENRGYFMASGGTEYNYIPCLNAADSHAELMQEIVLGQSMQ